MRRNILLLALSAMLFGAPQAANAQLGKLLKKVNKGLEKVNGKLSEGSTVASGGAVFTQENGVKVQNPMAAHYDVQLVGAYGVSTSENYGQVYLVVKVKMNDNATSLRFGGNTEFPVTAVDADGNSYAPMETAGWYDKNVTEGMYVKVNLGDLKSCTFKDVKKTARQLQMVRIGAGMGYHKNQGLITFRNVPILWDQQPE